MIVDKAGTSLSVNRAIEAITGFSKDDLIGSPCSALHCDIYEIARDENGDYWCVWFRTGSLKMRRCTLARKDGRYVHVLKNASGICAPSLLVRYTVKFTTGLPVSMVYCMTQASLQIFDLRTS
jgi:PAS domain S-box-containing protein